MLTSKTGLHYLKIIEWFRRAKDLASEVRETLQDILAAKEDACIALEKLLQAESYLQDVKPMPESKEAAAVEHSLSILARLSQPLKQQR